MGLVWFFVFLFFFQFFQILFFTFYCLIHLLVTLNPQVATDFSSQVKSPYYTLTEHQVPSFPLSTIHNGNVLRAYESVTDVCVLLQHASPMKVGVTFPSFYSQHLSKCQAPASTHVLPPLALFRVPEDFCVCQPHLLVSIQLS